jgi:hypothetical protein
LIVMKQADGRSRLRWLVDQTTILDSIHQGRGNGKPVYPHPVSKSVRLVRQYCQTSPLLNISQKPSVESQAASSQTSVTLGHSRNLRKSSGLFMLSKRPAESLLPAEIQLIGTWQVAVKRPLRRPRTYRRVGRPGSYQPPDHYSPRQAHFIQLLHQTRTNCSSTLKEDPPQPK